MEWTEEPARHHFLEMAASRAPTVGPHRKSCSSRYADSPSPSCRASQPVEWTEEPARHHFLEMAASRAP
ncbi:hypothetical protein, partial [Streptomyces sp. NPDC058335]|uniref:hypothetical protein n=1 Tax=Streptomyces sp. NPDC058335 TaxID=3346451 RepID=UPI0036676542